MVKTGAREFVYPNFGYRSRWLWNHDPVYGITVPCRRLPTIMAALYYYPLFELSDNTSNAQTVIFTCRLNNNSSNVFLLAKTVNTVK